MSSTKQRGSLGSSGQGRWPGFPAPDECVFPPFLPRPQPLLPSEGLTLGLPSVRLASCQCPSEPSLGGDLCPLWSQTPAGGNTQSPLALTRHTASMRQVLREDPDATRSKARAESTGAPGALLPGESRTGAEGLFLLHPPCCQHRRTALKGYRLLHTQYTQVSSMGTIKDIIRSSRVFFSLDHVAGPLEAHVPL